jgi:hypothetical protein
MPPPSRTASHCLAISVVVFVVFSSYSRTASPPPSAISPHRQNQPSSPSPAMPQSVSYPIVTSPSFCPLSSSVLYVLPKVLRSGSFASLHRWLHWLMAGRFSWLGGPDSVPLEDFASGRIKSVRGARMDRKEDSTARGPGLY